MTQRRLLVVLAVTLLVAGCGSGAADTGAAAAAGPCVGVEAPQVEVIGGWNPQPANAAIDLCPKAIALATDRLGWLHWPITSTRFTTSMCPPNARCLAVLVATSGWVIFTFAGGDPLMVRVGPPETGEPGLVAGDPEPPPEWLVEEIERAAT